MPTFDDILSDPYFAKLDKELSKFNIFHATDMKNREIKHTKFLGYLLDPNESHQLGTQFLWQFLRKIAAAGIKDLDLLNLNLQYTKINIEYKLESQRSLDLLLEIPKNDNKFLIIAIENKIRSTEGIGQLDHYLRGINENFNVNYIKNFAYLTINEEDPSNENWININYYSTVIPAIKELLSDSEETISSYMRFILQDYVEIINKEEDHNDQEDQAFEIYKSISSKIKEKIRTISNPEIGTPAYKIQLLYPRAFSYIKNFNDDARSNAIRAFEDFQTGNKNFHRESSKKTYLHFTNLNPNIQEFLSNGICSSPTRPTLRSKRNLAFEIELRPDENNNQSTLVSTRIILCPTNPEFNLRLEICNKIRNKFGLPLLNRAGSDFTRIYNLETNESVNNNDLQGKINKILDDYGKEKSETAAKLNTAIAEFVAENITRLSEIGVSEAILDSFK